MAAHVRNVPERNNNYQAIVKGLVFKNTAAGSGAAASGAGEEGGGEGGGAAAGGEGSLRYPGRLHAAMASCPCVPEQVAKERRENERGQGSERAREQRGVLAADA